MGFDIEVDGAGYGKTLRIELTMERLRLKDGHFDIAVGDGSKVEVRECGVSQRILSLRPQFDGEDQRLRPGRRPPLQMLGTGLSSPARRPSSGAASRSGRNWTNPALRHRRSGRPSTSIGISAAPAMRGPKVGVYRLPSSAWTIKSGGTISPTASTPSGMARSTTRFRSVTARLSDRFQKEIEMLGGTLRTSGKKAVRPIQCEGVYPMHLQGDLHEDERSIFWCFTDVLVKTDMNGRILKKTPVANHHGDLCYHDGKVYVAVNLGRFNDPKGNADSWVYVYDAEDLREAARHRVPEVVYGAGGIGRHAGRFVVVGGLPPGIGVRITPTSTTRTSHSCRSIRSRAATP